MLHANSQLHSAEKNIVSLLFTPGLFIQNSHTNLHNYLHKASDHNVIEITPHIYYYHDLTDIITGHILFILRYLI